jgi:hypothetical protein
MRHSNRSDKQSHKPHGNHKSHLGSATRDPASRPAMLWRAVRVITWHSRPTPTLTWWHQMNTDCPAMRQRLRVHPRQHCSRTFPVRAAFPLGATVSTYTFPVLLSSFSTSPSGRSSSTTVSVAPALRLCFAQRMNSWSLLALLPPPPRLLLSAVVAIPPTFDVEKGALAGVACDGAWKASVDEAVLCRTTAVTVATRRNEVCRRSVMMVGNTIGFWICSRVGDAASEMGPNRSGCLRTKGERPCETWSRR